MKRSTFWITIIIVAVVLGIAIAKFNGLSRFDEKRELAWTPLENVLKARYDLVPKLLNVVILYSGKEDPETKKIAGLRKQYGETRAFPEIVVAADSLETAITDMFIQISQRYPGISSSYEYVALQNGFNQSASAMQPLVDGYNLVVDQYNTYAREFPNNIVTKLFGFETRAPYFKRQ